MMSVDEWSARWKQNEAFQECLQCGSKSTKEHHFTQARVVAAVGEGTLRLVWCFAEAVLCLLIGRLSSPD